MANVDYIGSENRIVRIKNESLFTMIDGLAEKWNLPVQLVFECWCDLTIRSVARVTYGKLENYLIETV